MLTDDDLTGELRTAFDGATRDLEYTGRFPRPRRTAPKLAALTGVGVIAAGVLVSGQLAAGSGPAGPAAIPTQGPSLSATYTLVGKSVTLAEDPGDWPGNVKRDWAETFQDCAKPTRRDEPLSLDSCFAGLVVLQDGFELPGNAIPIIVDGRKGLWIGRDEYGSTSLYIDTDLPAGRSYLVHYNQHPELHWAGVERLATD